MGRTTRITKTVHLADLEHIVDGPLNHFLEQLEVFVTTAEEKGFTRDGMYLNIDYEYDYGGERTTTIALKGRRRETLEEAKARIQKDKEYKASLEESQRQTYLSLKEKFDKEK